MTFIAEYLTSVMYTVQIKLIYTASYTSASFIFNRHDTTHLVFEKYYYLILYILNNSNGKIPLLNTNGTYSNGITKKHAKLTSSNLLFFSLHNFNHIKFLSKILKYPCKSSQFAHFLSPQFNFCNL